MLIEFPYGKGSINTDIPSDNLISVVGPRYPKIDESAAHKIINALENPIKSQRIKDVAKGKVIILVTDLTRATPNPLLVPPLLEEIKKAGVKSDNIKIIVANGLHGHADEKGLEELLGKRVMEEVEVANHDPNDEKNLINLGTTSSGTPAIINKEVAETDFVLATGLIEPHFFAGYSGGRKNIFPGVAAERAIYSNHSYKMLDHPNATYGILRGNPVHEDMIEVLKFAKLDFIINVVLNKKREIMGVFAGDAIKAHEEGARFLDSIVKVKVKKEADIVIVTNGGYPLDRNFYQAAKGMATGSLVVKKGGVIIMLSECIDNTRALGGVVHDYYHKLCKGTKSPDEILKRVREQEPIKDQWQAQPLARILQKAEIITISEVKNQIVEDFLMTPASSLDEAMDMAFKKMGSDAGIIAIPEGPYIIPTL